MGDWKVSNQKLYTNSNDTWKPIFFVGTEFPIDSNASVSKEELLNYFTNWSELKQGDFEKLLVYCVNFEYNHFEILNSVEQFKEFIQIMTALFTKLESLAYIGKKKDTGIFVKEDKAKRSFLAD